MMDPLHILVVDDDMVARDLLREALASEGYTVTTAANGLEALERIRASTFHLVITDLAMPGLDGLALLKEAKRLVPHLQVILLTASREEQALNEALRRGAYVVISKPLGETEILRIIRDVLQHSQNDLSEWKSSRPAKRRWIKR
jgi:DNA-binding NtrC family response regulator